MKHLKTFESYNREPVDNKLAEEPRDNGLISSSMSKIGPVLNVNMQGYHDALTDCRLMMQMYQKMVDILKQNKRIDIMKYQVDRIKTLRK